MFPAHEALDAGHRSAGEFERRQVVQFELAVVDGVRQFEPHRAPALDCGFAFLIVKRERAALAFLRNVDGGISAGEQVGEGRGILRKERDADARADEERFAAGAVTGEQRTFEDAAVRLEPGLNVDR